MQQWAPPSNGDEWDEQRPAPWRAGPASQSIAEQERMHWMVSPQQQPSMNPHQQQQERPSVARAHSFPPPPQPSSSSSSARPSASSPGGSSHPNAYHPYASSPKKPLLFINTVPPTDASSSTKPKRKRIMPEQLKELCALFEITDSPSFDAREKVGQAVGMTNREVQVWFQNRRAKVNRERAAAQEAKQARPSTAPREGPPPLSSFTSRFSAATEEQHADGVGEHTWRYRHTPRSVPMPPDAPEGIESAFRLPPLPEPAPHGSLPPLPRPPLITRRSHPGPPPGRQYYEQPGGQGLGMPSPQSGYLLPSPQLSYRSPPTTHYSPSSFTPSFFGMTSPSISSSHGSTGSQMFTPNPGSAYSASSGYFSHPEGPYSPSNNFSSPSGNFLRLNLDSPHPGSAYSPRSNAGSFEHSPLPPTDAPIHLPPIVSPRIWNGPQGFNSDRDQREREYEVQRARQRDMERGHQRSQSEGTATDAMRLPPMRGSAEPPRPSSSSSRPPPSASHPTSPEGAPPAPLHPSPSRPSGSQPSSSPHSTKASQQQQQPPRRRTYPHPSSLARLSARGDEAEGEMGPPSGPGGVGLGMLAMAGEMVEDDETEREREARERYTATRKLSYNALREQASSAEGGAGKDAEMGGM